MVSKKAKESYSSVTEMVLPNDTNVLNNMMGGRIMHLMDIAGAIAAQRHSNRTVVTASVDNISFKRPIYLGNVITINAQVTRAFSTSMEVYIEVITENIPEKIKNKSHEAFYTFVGVNDQGKPVKIPELIPETERELELFKSAQQRRDLRLLLDGRIKPEDASSIKSLFDGKD